MENLLKNKDFILKAFWRASQLIVKQGMNIYILFIVLKFSSQTDAGLYSYMASIALFLALLGDFGISTATSKFVTEYSLFDKEKLKSVFITSVFISFLSSVLFSLILLVGNGRIFHADSKYIIFLILLIFLIPITYIQDGILRGLKKFKLLSLVTLIIGATLLFPVYFLIKQFGITGAFIGQVLFYILLAIALGVAYTEINFKVNFKVLKDIVIYSFFCGVASVGYQLFSRTDILVLGHFNYLKEIATYDLLNRFFIILTAPFAILAQIIAPDFTSLIAKGEFKKIYTELKKYSIITFVSASIMGVFALIFIPFFIKIFFPDYYNDILFKLLPLASVIFIANASALTIDLGIIIPTGYAKIMTSFYLILALVNFIFSLFFLKIFGYIGPIYATLFASICMVVVIRVIYFRKIKNLIS
jgi:O-antigen/teichoic acid export membrane protein